MDTSQKTDFGPKVDWPPEGLQMADFGTKDLPPEELGKRSVVIEMVERMVVVTMQRLMVYSWNLGYHKVAISLPQTMLTVTDLAF